MLFWVVSIFFIIFMGLGMVAFMTLLERKVLGLSQARLGPSKVSFFGLVQPVSDGIKLLFKQSFFVLSARSALFILGPSMVFLLFVFIWSAIVPWMGELSSMKYSSLMFFSLLGLGSYATIMVGWSSLSSFSNLGSLRGMLQNLSFEVAIILAFFFILSFFKSIMLKSEDFFFLDLILFWLIVWIILSLMETNRAPFDLLEGESELISGFNIEMGSSLFVLLFLSEYGMMMVMALLFSVTTLGFLSETSICFLYVMILMRSCFPRIRFDLMMTSMWTSLLPMVLLMFMDLLFFLYSLAY